MTTTPLRVSESFMKSLFLVSMSPEFFFKSCFVNIDERQEYHIREKLLKNGQNKGFSTIVPKECAQTIFLCPQMNSAHQCDHFEVSTVAIAPQILKIEILARGHPSCKCSLCDLSLCLSFSAV